MKFYHCLYRVAKKPENLELDSLGSYLLQKSRVVTHSLRELGKTQGVFKFLKLFWWFRETQGSFNIFINFSGYFYHFLNFRQFFFIDFEWDLVLIICFITNFVNNFIFIDIKKMLKFLQGFEKYRDDSRQFKVT